MSNGAVIPLDLRNAGRDPEKRDEINRQGLGVGNAGEPANTITKEFSHGVAVAFSGDIARTLQARHDSSPCADRGMDVVAVDTYNQTEHSTTQPVRSAASDVDHTGGVINPAERMAVRRLTPRECERLQGFTTRTRRAMISVCFDQQKRSARVAVKCLRLPSSALIADADESLESALSADQNFQSDRANQENVVVLHVLQLHETRLLKILSAGKLMWSASGAVPLSEFLPYIPQGDIAQLLVQVLQGLEALTRDGKAASPEQETHFTLPANGSWYARWFGPEKTESASDADASETEDITSITSNPSLQKLSCEQSQATWLCSALSVIGSFIPKTIPAKSSVRFVLDVESDHTLIPWRGKSPELCPDGPRYKALGNSMAVPCMRWIGERIAKIDARSIRYLSVCSGIEAASVAWEPIGWTPVAFAEVEKFPSAVLAHHWPDVPNLGDMTKYESWNLGAIDLLVGGTPCQSFSVAGLRKGLRDPRGGLMLTFLEIAQRQRPRWIVWENVPGVLSSHGGRDFGAFLGALGALGYGWAYRVLDAQWFGVAQRRRRVFVVGCLGDGAAAATVLFESESVQRNPAPSREKGQGVAAFTPSSIGDYRQGYGTLRANGGDNGGGSEVLVAASNPKAFTHSNYSNKPAWITGDRTDCLGSAGHHDSSTQGIGILDPRSQPIAEADVVGTLSDGAHNGGGLTAKMPTPGAYLPCVANPLTARMGKGINTTLDEGQTAIVCQGEGGNDL